MRRVIYVVGVVWALATFSGCKKGDSGGSAATPRTFELSTFAGAPAVWFFDEPVRVSNALTQSSPPGAPRRPSHGFPDEDESSWREEYRDITYDDYGRMISYVVTVAFPASGNSYQLTVTGISYDSGNMLVGYTVDLVATIGGQAIQYGYVLSQFARDTLGRVWSYDETRSHEGIEVHTISFKNIARDINGDVDAFSATVDGVETFFPQPE